MVAGSMEEGEKKKMGGLLLLPPRAGDGVDLRPADVLAGNPVLFRGGRS